MLEWVELDVAKELEKYQEPVESDNPEFDRYRYEVMTYHAAFHFRSGEYKDIEKTLKDAPEETRKALMHKSAPGYRFKARKGIGASFHFTPRPVAVLFRFDLTDDVPALKKKLKEFSDELVEYVEREKSNLLKSSNHDEIIMTDYIRSKDGSIKPPEQLFELWGKCLDIWDEFLECQNKSEVSRRMGWYDRNRSAKCVEEISKYLKFTQRLIDSTTDGTFLQVAAIPFTEGKTRKQRELKRKKT